MPKKNKKQKMASEKRKSEHSYAPHVTVFTAPSIEQSSEKKELKTPDKVVDSETSAYTAIFKKELTKSLIISAFIILVEIGVYLAQNNVISIKNFL
jgi:hypothetical protein